MSTPEAVFARYDQTYGDELWITDGTASGTHLLKDINSGSGGSAPHYFAALPGGKALFFAASTGGPQGYDLWVTDGTSPGTSAIATLGPGGRASFAPSNFVSLYGSNEVLFRVVGATAAQNTTATTAAYTLWVSDGTSIGTHVLSDMTDSGLSANLYSQVPYNVKEITSLGASSTQAVFVGSFYSNNASYTNLFVTDGTSAGTHLVNTLYQAGVTPRKIQGLTAGATKDFFVAQTYGESGTASYEVWVTDGTASGTNAVTSYPALRINPTAEPSSDRPLAGFKSGALFVAGTSTSSYQLWYTDGTASGTHVITNDPLFTTEPDSPHYITAFTGSGNSPLALFDAPSGMYSGSPQLDLFVTDGTTSGTFELTNLKTPAGVYNGEPTNFTTLGDKVVFTAQGTPQGDANYGTIGNELWVTDGTVSGTYLLKDINPPPYYSSNPQKFHVLGNEIVFVATGTDGQQLWETDGTRAGTQEITTVYGGFLGVYGGTSLGAPCYVRGTRVLTPLGEVAVEDLEVGDLVSTLNNGAQPVRWIGRRRVMAADGRPDLTVLPVCIARDALGYGVPHRDLLISPDHAILLDGVLVPAQFLVNGRTITRHLEMRDVEYFHIELPAHDIILAEGAAAETYLDTGNRTNFDNGTSPNDDLKPVDGASIPIFCAPLVDNGDKLAAIRWALNIRAETKGLRLTRDPDLHLLADGAEIRAEWVQDGRYRFRVPTAPALMQIRSRAEIPACIEGTNDWRRLGVALDRIILSDGSITTEISSAAACLNEGFSYLEPGFRWTDGDATIPATLFAAFSTTFTVELLLAKTLDYPLPISGSFNGTRRENGSEQEVCQEDGRRQNWPKTAASSTIH